MAKTRPPDESNGISGYTPTKENTDGYTNEPKEKEQAPPEQGVSALQMLTVMDRMTAAIEKLANIQAAGQGNEQVNRLMETLSTAMVRMSETQMQGSQLVADQTRQIALETRRAHRPSNETPRNVSVFNRRGTLLEDHPDPKMRYSKPKLKCLMMIPWMVEWESCTREEVELLNLLQPGEYSLKRIDNSKIKVTVVITWGVDNLTPSQLVISHDTAYGNDQFKLMPALSDLLRQILKQHDMMTRAKASQVLSDEDEEALIETGDLSVSL